MIRIILADDHPLVMEGIKLMLADEKDIEVIAQATQSEELMELLQNHSPHLILIDINMPGENGIKTTQKIKRLYPEIHLIGLSMYRELSIIKAMLKAGATGYLIKNSPKEEIVKAIREVMAGKQYCPEEVHKILKKQNDKTKEKPLFPSLSKREKEVLKLIIKEYTTKEIAEKLLISFNTVESHRKNMLIKLGARNTAGLVSTCLEYDLLNTKK